MIILTIKKAGVKQFFGDTRSTTAAWAHGANFAPQARLATIHIFTTTKTAKAAWEWWKTWHLDEIKEFNLKPSFQKIGAPK